MKKGQKTPEQKIVEYKGTTFVLPPGHKVFQLDLRTGKVSEHKITRKFDLLFWRKPRFGVTYKEHLLHIPAFDIHKARIRFKHMTKNLDIRIK